MQLINRFSFIIPTILGFLAFLLVIGWRILDPSNIAWLNYGDAAQHYLGWLFYRNSEWSFPIGMNPNYGLELSSSIVFTDSIPILAIFFKLLSPLLPETFQYFGLWYLICFVLQSYFSWRLVGLYTTNYTIRILAVGLFLFSPTFLLRSYMHITLTAHFFVIAALFFALSKDIKNRQLCWSLLIAVVTLVHAYFLALVLIIWMFDILGRFFKKELTFRTIAGEFLVVFTVILLLGWQAGYFSVASGLNIGGFGYYRMNLLSPFNSDGSWSYILGRLPTLGGDYEGFNFLGSGVLLLILLLLPILFVKRNEIVILIKGYWYIVLMAIALTFFALSNKIAIGAYEISYYIPGFLLKIAEIFRASGRFFWPVFYLIVLFSVYCCIRYLKYGVAILFLLIVFVIQLVDTSKGWLPHKNYLLFKYGNSWSIPQQHPFWHDAAQKYNNIRQIPVKNMSSSWLDISYFAGVNNLSTDAVYLARVGSVNLQDAIKKSEHALVTGLYDQDSLYILNDAAFYAALLSGNTQQHLFARIDGFNVIAPGWKVCDKCQLVSVVSLDDITKPLNGSKKYLFNDVGTGRDFLGYGWSSSEGWGTWSQADMATLYIPIQAKTVGSILIESNAFITHKHPQQRVDVLINDVLVSSWVLNEDTSVAEIVLPEQVKSTDQGLKIEFLFFDAVSPKDIGLGGDTRRLALGLVSLELRE